jgi:hypothetical protein
MMVIINKKATEAFAFGIKLKVSATRSLVFNSSTLKQRDIRVQPSS